MAMLHEHHPAPTHLCGRMLRWGMLRQPLILEHVHQRRLAGIIQSLRAWRVDYRRYGAPATLTHAARTKKRILAFLLYKPSWFNTL